MRLINADALPREKMLAARGNGQYEDVDIVYGDDIDNAPTFDLVRCKDCTAWQNGVNWPADLPKDVGVCIIAGWICGENGHCLYGKRGESKTETITPAKHGRWEEDWLASTRGGSYRVWRCNLCGDTSTWKTNYCPECGARMDGGTVDETD